MARRHPWAARLPEGGELFLSQQTAFEQDFNAFYPQLQAACAAFSDAYAADL